MLIGCFGEVNEGMLAYVGEMLAQAYTSKEDVTVLVSTYGGELYPALGIHDMLRHHAKAGYKVTTVATGACMSAGMVILQGGTIRAMTENAQLMTHYGQDGAGSEGDATQNKKLHELHKQLVGHKTKVSTRTINSWFRQETYFDKKRALEVGLVDEVIEND